MDFSFSTEEEDFRQEVRDLFIRHEETAAGAMKEWIPGKVLALTVGKSWEKLAERDGFVRHGPKNMGG